MVAFLNRVTRYGRVPADMDGFLDNVRNGSLSLYRFDEDVTLLVNTVSQWFGEGEIVSVVLRTQGKKVVYTLSKNGQVHIVDMFVTVKDTSPVVYMLSNHDGHYYWREFEDMEVIAPYLHRIGWRNSNQ